jgi:CRP-like cAMP-binding protein
VKPYTDDARSCPLFNGLDIDSIESLMACLSPKEKTIEKNAFVFMEDDAFNSIGIVLEGALHVVRDDFWGNSHIVTRLGKGDLLAESFVCGGLKKMPVSILAVEPSTILLFDFTKIITTCSSACTFHARIIKNMIAILAQKNISLIEKLQHLTQHNTREKIISYLDSVAKDKSTYAGKTISSVHDSFEIPFNRQELAEYLSVDRSALSAELCRMRDDGILVFHKNTFRLIK